MRWSNCLFFAARLWWRRRPICRQLRRRCYVDIRESDWGKFPHFVYRERHHQVAFIPASPIPRRFPPPLFRGRVRWGDPPPKDNHGPAR